MRPPARPSLVRLRPLLLCATLVLLTTGAATPRAQTDLDAFMRQVVETRDTNWKKLQQYVLDEREQVEMRGPAGTPLWGERRDYTWYVRDGFFIRSPLRVNGAAVGEAERVKYEQAFLERERRREASASGDVAVSGPASAPVDADAAPHDVDGLIRQSRQPQFISSAYFLRFRFDEGRYALVGREPFEGREVLRIEYYPNTLFTPSRRQERRDDRGIRREPRERDASETSQDTELMRLMNRASRVTLWIVPESHQIVKYTFDDLGWNFFPGQWLAQMDGVTASMTMGEMFPDVWLPRSLEMHVGLLMALGNVQMRYALQYDNYRQADVQSKIGVPDRP
ncbi:MAG: hypothetical protein ABL982_17535 [Vicinamibacterales bacterium]